MLFTDTLNAATSMRYGLTKPFLDENPFLEISAEEYHSIALVRQQLVRAMAVEEKFDLVVENFEEFEHDLLRTTLRDAMFSDRSWEVLIKDLQRLNRRLVNLLTTCRLYLDQVSHNLSSIWGKESAPCAAIQERRRAEYDQNLGYRFLEALRNYVQHRDLPIVSLGFNSSRHDNAGHSILKHITTPRIRLSALREDPKFKRSILGELETLGEELDLKPFVRDYVSGIGRIHEAVREQLALDTAKWDQKIRDVIDSYCNITGDRDFGLVAVFEHGGERYSGMVHIGTDILDRRRALEKKNKYISHFGQNVISGEVHMKNP